MAVSSNTSAVKIVSCLDAKGALLSVNVSASGNYKVPLSSILFLFSPLLHSPLSPLSPSTFLRDFPLPCRIADRVRLSGGQLQCGARFIGRSVLNSEHLGDQLFAERSAGHLPTGALQCGRLRTGGSGCAFSPFTSSSDYIFSSFLLLFLLLDIGLAEIYIIAIAVVAAVVVLAVIVVVVLFGVPSIRKKVLPYKDRTMWAKSEPVH